MVGFSRPVAEQETVTSLSNSMHCSGWGGGVNFSFSARDRCAVKPPQEALEVRGITPAPCQAKELPTRGRCVVLVNIPSTCTRAYPSMLPAGVLLTHLYMVPSYTSTLLMRSVPFSEISNRESYPEGGREWGKNDSVTSRGFRPCL